jgi:hypothetical protein
MALKIEYVGMTIKCTTEVSDILCYIATCRVVGVTKITGYSSDD